MANVLVAEDEKALNDAYVMILSRAGHVVKSALDGAEALKITEDFEPDVILLDLRMPAIGGIEFLKEYDLPKKHPQVKVIIFSNLDMQREIDEAFRLGASKYMLKSWASPKELVRLIEEQLEEKSGKSK
jgi:DNA-binding NarL/FixJ family response regulator